MTQATPPTPIGPKWSPATRRLVVIVFIVLIAITAGLQVGDILGAIIAVPLVATYKTVAVYLWRKAVPEAL